MPSRSCALPATAQLPSAKSACTPPRRPSSGLLSVSRGTTGGQPSPCREAQNDAWQLQFLLQSKAGNWRCPVKQFRINGEVHAGWCPPGTSNPVGLPLVDRSVRFRHTSARFFLLLAQMARGRKPKPFRASKEVRRQARIRVGSPPPVRRHESPKRKPPKHKKREIQQGTEML